MFNKINNIFLKFNNFFKNKKYLLTISGGVDSMVLLNIFYKILNNNISVAHCNFTILNNKINYNYNLIYNYCKKRNIIFFYKKFNTIKYSNNKNISLQMAARELRYKWFNKLKIKYNYNYIVLGHNLDDSIETFFINIFRKTGIYGLKGINFFINKKYILRPLIYFYKNNIINYALINKINWNNDISNNKNYYFRNKVRNIIIPNIYKNIKLVKNNIKNTILNLKIEYNFINKIIKIYKKKIIINNEKTKEYLFKINIIKLLNLGIKYNNYLLYKIFYKYYFYDINIYNKLLILKTGKYYISKNRKYKIIKNKNYIFLLLNNNKNKINLKINKLKKYNIKILNKKYIINLKLKNNKNLKLCNINYIYINYNKIKLPLYIRNWEKGDYIINNNKKILINKILKKYKILSFNKNNILLLLNYNNEIICTLNYLKIINNNYFIKNKNKKILILNFLNLNE
ncbi:MAG: hypothetical protein RDO_0900 [Flavobacteriales endosymbiont of Rhyzopertha dominica]|nr:MAG: tRNA lysidine(34) synthetase TilS [Candidatus Shikimatogenerans bostrichidophilus]